MYVDVMTVDQEKNGEKEREISQYIISILKTNKVVSLKLKIIFSFQLLCK